MANSGKVIERGSDGVAFEAATPASQPGDIFPAGIVMAYAGAAAPTNWLICDGTAVSRSTYPNLFAAIGTTYGAGDGTTTFNLPDLRGRVPVGKHTAGTFVTLGATGGEETHAMTTAEMAVHSHGVTDPTHSHSSPAHGHGVTDPGHAHAVNYNSISNNTTGGGGNAVTGITGGAGGTVGQNSGSAGTGIGIQGAAVSINAAGTGIGINNAGSGTAHNNLQPYMVLNYIVKAS